MKTLPQSLKKVSQNQEKGWKLKDTDEFYSILLSGTYVLGSCQHIDKSPTLNKALLAYIVDGKNRPIIVYNEKKEPVARSMMTLGVDSVTGEPKMFLEPIYPLILDNTIKKAIVNYAIKKCTLLKVDLLTSTNFISFFEVDSYGPFPHTFVAKGNNKTPYEYVDALKGIQNNNQFKINKVSYLYKHGA